MLLQNFNFRFDDPSYQLHIKQTLTIKPKDFFMHATLRERIDPIYLERMLHNGARPEIKLAEEIPDTKANRLVEAPKKLMTVLYGSNSGTCEALAQSLARVATSRGYRVQVDPLDAGVDKIPKDQPVILISSSYEGEPPDNAVHFVQWLENLNAEKRLAGVNYAVYGCGNRKSPV